MSLEEMSPRITLSVCSGFCSGIVLRCWYFLVIAASQARMILCATSNIIHHRMKWYCIFKRGACEVVLHETKMCPEMRWKYLRNLCLVYFVVVSFSSSITFGLAVVTVHFAVCGMVETLESR